MDKSKKRGPGIVQIRRKPVRHKKAARFRKAEAGGFYVYGIARMGGWEAE